jgi:hypothetical protein
MVANNTNNAADREILRLLRIRQKLQKAMLPAIEELERIENELETHIALLEGRPKRLKMLAMAFKTAS